MEVVTDAPSSREMEHRLNTLQTSLSVVERSIMKYENLIEDCRMLEEEVRHIEEDEGPPGRGDPPGAGGGGRRCQDG